MGIVLVAGAGGFIGGHMVRRLVERGIPVRAVDCKVPENWICRSPEAENLVCDVAEKDSCYRVMRGVETVFNFAADMGGMGFIEHNKASCMLSVLINTHLLMAARDNRVARFLFASSACVYPDYRQTVTDVPGLRESDAYPAMPEDGYGWEKLFSERMCRHFREDFGVNTRIARYHNIYGPLATWEGGREKAPAAIARKVALAAITGKHEIEIWGDGQQTRSFTYIDDCLRGTELLMQSEIAEPLNIGSDEMVSIDQLVSTVEAIAGITLARRYDPDAPRGVRGRNSDNTLISNVLDWVPATPLRVGMEKTYAWVYDQVRARIDGRAAVDAVR